MTGCKDCEQCTRSFVSKLGSAALTVSTMGLSRLPAAIAASFKRQCPQCGHPMSDHEAARAQIAVLMAQQTPPPPTTEPATFTARPAVPPTQANASDARPGLPWHQQPVTVILALVFFAPLGIALMWWHKLWSQRIRVIASVASAIPFIAAVVSGPGDSTRQRSVELSPTVANQLEKSSTVAPDVTVPAAMPVQGSDSQDEIERSCGLANGERPRFVKRKLERYDNVNVPRVQVRISVPSGLSRRELQENLCVAALQAYSEAGKGTLGAVAVLAYDGEQVSGMYTAAKTDFAPDGNWDKADPTVPVSKWRFSIEYAKSYFGRSSDGDAVAGSAPTKPVPSAGTQAAEDLPPGTFVTKEGYIGALSKERLDQAISLLASRDNAAFDQLLAFREVFALKKGLQVTVVDHEGFLASVVKVRKRGTLLEFWTVSEALGSP